jgi:hypothetical protein
MADIEQAGLSNPRVLLQMLIEKNADPETLKKWVDLIVPLEDRAAEKAFNVAFVEAQARMPRFVEDKKNPETNTGYISVEAIQAVLTPIMTEHGFAVSWEPGIIVKDGTTRMKARLSHIGGHSRTYEGDYACDDKGPKGGAQKTQIQGTVSSHTYGQRDMLRLIWNLTIVGADKDGRAQGLSKDEIKEINGLIEECEQLQAAGAFEQAFDVAKFFAFLKVETLEQLPGRDFVRVVRVLNQKRRTARIGDA